MGKTNKIDYQTIIDLSTKLDMFSYYLGSPNRIGRFKCPFNLSESNHNLSIYENRWYCFSCGQGGNIIHLVSHIYDMSYNDASIKIINDFGLTYLLNPTDKELEEIKRKALQREKDIQEKRKFNASKKEIYNDILHKLSIVDNIIEGLYPDYELEDELDIARFSYSVGARYILGYLKKREYLNTLSDIICGQHIDYDSADNSLLIKINYDDSSKSKLDNCSDRLCRLILKGEITIDLYD